MKTRIGVSVVAAALALLTPMTMAGASEPDEASSPDNSEPTHCVHNLDTGETACDSSASVARQRAADGRQLYTLARFYDWVNFNSDGDSFAVSTGSPCTDAYDDEVNQRNLRDLFTNENWDNRISSVRTYNNCDVKLYDNLNVEGPFEGPSSTWIDQADHLSQVGDGWNDRASSYRIS